MKSSEESKVFEEKRKKDNLKMKLKAIFQECYPGLVDLNGNIKYPINDKLLRKMPILHDIDEIPTRPKMFKVFLYENPEEFEDLLQIWEFASNCLQLPKSFKIEELYAGLKFTDNEEEVTLISEIVWKILEMAIQEIPDEEREDEDSLIWMIKQTISNKLRFVWPCLISIFLKAGLFEYTPGEDIIEIGVILKNATPKNFNSLLTYDQKIKILLFLWNSCHDFQAFREYLSERLKEKHKYSKEKQDTYSEIRKIDQEKKKLMQKHASSDFVENEGVKGEIVVLEEELKNASRTQAKVIRDKLSSLNKEKEAFRKKLSSLDEKIESFNNKIARLNDSLFKVSVKISIIGYDLNNEYWYFKDEPNKIYVKDLETKKWGYYNDEESILQLENSLITKGLKERKLYEGLRRLKGKMRVRRTKEIQNNTEEKSEDVENQNESKDKEEKKTDSGEVSKEKPKTEEVDMEVDTDPKYENYQEEIDWDKNCEKAIQFSMKKSEISTRRSNRMNSKLDVLSLPSIKEKMLDLEDEYTEASKEIDKSWAPHSTIEKIK